MAVSEIVIRGAAEHNLKRIDLTLPRNRLIVITGVSGSGKSSLAFDTLYAEGQRRYVESLSAYARQFLEQMEKPNVESIEGLSPAISIEQKTTLRNPRSTVGTVTEIYDYLRLAVRQGGTTTLPSIAAKPITSQSVQQIVDAVLELREGQPHPGAWRRSSAVAKASTRKEFREAARHGLRACARGRPRCAPWTTRSISTRTRNTRSRSSSIASGAGTPGLKNRLTDSVETAPGRRRMVLVVIERRRKGRPDLLFSRHLACNDCGVSVPQLAPRDLLVQLAVRGLSRLRRPRRQEGPSTSLAKLHSPTTSKSLREGAPRWGDANWYHMCSRAGLYRSLQASTPARPTNKLPATVQAG